MLIVNRVKEFRKQNKFTQEELARRVGVSRKTIVSLEKGNYIPSLLLAFQIANVLQVDIKEIFELQENYE
jgi:putative transcriptional regulator